MSKKTGKRELPFEEEISTQEKVIEVKAKKISRKPRRVRVKYRQVVYVGTADKSTIRGAVTGKKYLFFKDKYGMPKAIRVDERDYPGVIALKGKGCARRSPDALFISKQDWDLEIAGAKAVNR